MGTLRIGNTVITPSSIKGINTKSLSVTANGTYALPEGVTGYDRVNVNVSNGTKKVVVANKTNTDITSGSKVWLNGTDIVTFDEVNVNSNVGIAESAIVSNGSGVVIVLDA